MANLIQDPLTQLIHFNIRKSINLCLDNGCVSSAVILIYSGMDTMAYLNLPAGRKEVNRTDFIRWAGRYIRFPCEEQLSGEDLYGARCAMLHRHGITSKMSREGKCRRITYMNRLIPEIRFDRSVASDLVVVSAQGLADAFFQGVDDFLIEAFTSHERAELVETRLRSVVICHSRPNETEAGITR